MHSSRNPSGTKAMHKPVVEITDTIELPLSTPIISADISPKAADWIRPSVRDRYAPTASKIHPRRMVALRLETT